MWPRPESGRWPSPVSDSPSRYRLRLSTVRHVNEEANMGATLMIRELFEEVKAALPRAAKMLGVKPDKVYILEETYREHMREVKFKDQAVECIGPSEVLEQPIIFNGLHKNSDFHAFGLTKYLCSTNPDVAYIIFVTRLGSNTYYLAFIAHEKLFRYQRHIQRMKDRNEDEVLPPVLKEGLLEAITEKSIKFLDEADAIEHYKVRIRRGILLGGEPGNGKTMACRWLQKLANDAGIDTKSITISALSQAFGNDSLIELLNSAPMVFFDDIDLSFLSRDPGAGGDAKAAGAFASALDGFGPNKHVVRIFTSNEAVDAVDKAFKRPGRIDSWYTFDPPNKALRLNLIKRWPESVLSNIDSDMLASETKNFSFADLEAVKAQLVTNFLFHKIDWDVDLAIREFIDTRPEDGIGRGRKAFGFGASMGQSVEAPVSDGMEDVPGS